MKMPLLIALLLFSQLIFAQGNGISTYESRYNDLHALERRELDSKMSLGDLIGPAYEERFGQTAERKTLRRIEAGDLDWIIKSAHLAVFYTHEQRYLHDLQLTLAELERRGAATDPQRVLFYQSLFALRRFDEARTYRDRHPALQVEEVPLIDPEPADENGAVRAYAVDPEQRRLLPKFFPLSEDAVLVVVSHPLCAFSRSAMETIAGDPELSSAIDGSSLWLTPVDMRLYFDEVQAWNREHPQTAVLIARHRRDWPMIDNWSTPNFYLLRQGEVVDHFSGWPLDGSHRDRLVLMLSRGGLLPSP